MVVSLVTVFCSLCQSTCLSSSQVPNNDLLPGVCLYRSVSLHVSLPLSLCEYFSLAGLLPLFYPTCFLLFLYFVLVPCSYSISSFSSSFSACVYIYMFLVLSCLSTSTLVSLKPPSLSHLSSTFTCLSPPTTLFVYVSLSLNEYISVVILSRSLQLINLRG